MGPRCTCIPGPLRRRPWDEVDDRCAAFVEEFAEGEVVDEGSEPGVLGTVQLRWCDAAICPGGLRSGPRWEGRIANRFDSGGVLTAAVRESLAVIASPSCVRRLAAVRTCSSRRPVLIGCRPPDVYDPRYRQAEYDARLLLELAGVAKDDPRVRRWATIGAERRDRRRWPEPPRGIA